MKYARITEVDNTGQQIYCRKCGKPSGILKYGGQVFQLGNVQVFNSIRYSCICGFPVTFYPPPIDDDNDTKSLGKDSRQVLIKLGKQRLTGEE
jgi:hypothetical protein